MVWESKASLIQAHYLARYAARMTYALEPGFNPALRIPASGPYNQRFGYTQLPQFVSSL